MACAEGRTCYDADSHLMELSDWLEQHADPSVREKLRPLHLGGAGKLAEQAVADEEPFPFSSDHPHPEGGRDPLARFEESLGDTSPAARERFYSGNFAEMMFMA